MASFKRNLCKNASKEINDLEDQKLNLLATRVAQNLVASPGMEVEPFTQEEKTKLEASLGLSQEQVQNVISGITELLQEAAYHGLSAKQLASELTSSGLVETKVKVLASVWSNADGPITNALTNKTSILPQVSHIGYNLSVDAGSDASAGDAKLSALRGIIQLGLEKNSQSETLLTEFSHQQLSDFHNQLNRIQEQLDAIADK